MNYNVTNTTEHGCIINSLLVSVWVMIVCLGVVGTWLGEVVSSDGLVGTLHELVTVTCFLI